MGMGYGAGYADVVTEYFIRRQCPAEFRAFMKAIGPDGAGTDLEAIAQHLSQQCDLDLSFETTKDYEKAVGLIHSAWKKLQRAFKRATTLDLDISYHNSNDEGDRYDDVNGAFFCVGGVWQRTPAGKKYQRSVSRKFYVTFG